jgi:N6-L-threonylcarbamoyladenine synthase
MNKNKDSIILGIESSCDDTSAAVMKNGILLSNVIANQSIHQKYGGVVPELASRAHEENIVPVVATALNEANVNIKNLTSISFTKGPGLLGSLLVGTSFAKSLSLSLNIPLIEVNHMMAHVHANFIQKKNENTNKPNFPFICLTVSGGHTQIVWVEKPLDMKIIGSTIDDAVGEAFDKAGKILGLGYPAGPIIDKLSLKGNEDKFNFTFPNAGDYNYSFSGLKTQFLNFIKKEIQSNSQFVNKNLNDICASYQSHLIKYLLLVLKKVIKKYDCKDIALAGGVSANSQLRKEFENLGIKMNLNTFIPDINYCTDNAAMIAMSGKFNEEKEIYSDLSTSASARIPIESMQRF